MSDDNKNPSSQGQDPLAALEDILKDAKAKSGDPASSVPVKNDTEPAVVELSEAEKQALEVLREQDELALVAERQKQVEQYRQEMKGVIQQTDAYKARVSQDDEEKQEKAGAVPADGFDIKQLEHKKI